ncbi:recombinase family protein [Ethanoligenens sp.]|uniref:recombinase family protein n=1 Tax=Ethanoligenens sp. TaxID=2099655 RepID=UPI0039ED84AC
MQESNPFFLHVAMYLRKSRAEEGEDTEIVLARHKAQLTKYAVEHHVNVVRIYDEVVSGDSLFARPRMVELLHDIEGGKYTGILCMDIDRLGRGNMKEQGLILETLKDSETVIITPDKVYDLNNELDETQSEFKTFMARQELKIIKKRLNRGIHMTLEKGGYVSNVPFGYIRVYKDKIPTLAPDPKESEYVKLIFKWYVAGDGCPEICHKLTAMGIKAPRGNDFSRNTVRKIIMNPTYIGKIVWGQKKHIRPKKLGDKNKIIYLPREQWLMFDGLHPAIIDENIYNEANMILSGRYHPPYREPNKIMNPLSGILICRQCGHAMTRRPYGKRKYQTDHILCPTTGCVKSSRADYVEQSFMHELELKLQQLEIAQTAQDFDSDISQTHTILENMKSEYSKLTKQRKRLYDLLEQEIYTISVFNEREKLLSMHIEGLFKDIQTTEMELTSKCSRAKILIPQIRYVLQVYWDSTPDIKNQLLKKVVSRAYYFKTKDASPKDFSIEIELRRE